MAHPVRSKLSERCNILWFLICSARRALYAARGYAVLPCMFCAVVSPGAYERVLSTLLNEMDGVESSSGVVVLGATTRPDSVDAVRLCSFTDVPAGCILYQMSVLAGFVSTWSI